MSGRLVSIVGALLALGCAAGDAQRQSRHHAFTVQQVVDGLEHPWSVAFLPGGDFLITERGGTLRIVRNGTVLRAPAAGVPQVRAEGQGGLLDVVLHPQFASNRFVYLSYSKPGPRGSTTAVVRGRLDGNRLTDVREIFEAKAWAHSGAHFGSRLAFDRDGFLYISIGDRGTRSSAQDLSDHTGNILRLHDDGRVPANNPFANRRDAQPEIYTYGNRNPQGLAYDRESGALYATEHGARGGDELNLIRPGVNYGWPLVTYGVDYSGARISDRQEMQGVENPLHYWVPSIGTSGLTVYRGDRFPNWRGDLFAGGLVGEQLVRLRFSGTRKVEVEKVLDGVGRIRDVRTGPDGYIYVLTDARNGRLLRLVPTARSR